MANTPVTEPPRFTGGPRHDLIQVTDDELFELVRKALEPSFVLMRRIGAGGMGIVYRARDPALKRLVAVKVMAPEHAVHPEVRARFQREAEAVAKISHPNVVAIYSVGELANGLPYLLMQYVDGPTMQERLQREGPFDLETAKQVLGQVASALEAAHAKGIVHRDIKGGNILWDDAAGRALVSDFGIAAIIEHDDLVSTSRLTQTGARVGTPRYMSPEQLLSEPVTERSDIYSLGLLGYELLTGDGPYQASSPNQLVAAHLRDAPRPLSQLRPDVDPATESLLASCLEKDAEARPSAVEIARRLQHGASVLLEWPPPGLEELQGAMARPLTRVILGGFALAGPLSVAATAGRDSPLRPSGAGVVIMPVIAAMGAVSLLFAASDLVRITRLTFRAARAGYGWGTIAEVLADADRDTGALITGEREFAALSAMQRSRLRDWRVRRMVLQGAAGLWLISGFLVALPIAVRTQSTGLLGLLMLGVPLGLLLASRAASAWEQRVLKPVRSRWKQYRAPLDRLSQLAATWRDAFDRVRAPLTRGVGAVGRVRRRILAVGSAVAIAGAGLLTATGLVALTAGNQVMTEMRVRTLSDFRARAQAIEFLRSYRPTIDPAVTPLEAGYALQSLVTAGRGASRSPVEKPVRSPIATPLELPSGPQPPINMLGSQVIETSYRHRLTAAQRAYLEQLAALPGARELEVLARAKSADWISAMIVTPMSVAPIGLPILRFRQVQNAGLGHLARAALAADRGDLATVKKNLEEIIGVGAVLLEGHNVMENVTGVRLLEIAHPELAAYYDITGPVVLAINLRRAPGWRPTPAVRSTEGTLSRQQREIYIREIVLDQFAPKGVRWEMVTYQMAYEPCGHVQQMLFGPDEVHRRRMAEARRALVVTPGDDQLMRAAEQATEMFVSPSAAGIPVPPPYRVLVRLGGAIDALTGSHRMKACMTLRPVTETP